MSRRVVTTTSASGTLTSFEDRARHAVDEVVAAVGGRGESRSLGWCREAAGELVKRSGTVDLVVLGSRGYGPPRTMLMGSVCASGSRGALSGDDPGGRFGDRAAA
jgi:hypothetical protein